MVELANESLILTCFCLNLMASPVSTLESTKSNAGKMMVELNNIGWAMFGVISIFILMNLLVILMEAFVNIMSVYQIIRKWRNRGLEHTSKIANYDSTLERPSNGPASETKYEDD